MEFRKILLALLVPLLGAWRPYETPDGDTTPPGVAAAEWGLVTVGLYPQQTSLAVPQLLVRLGVADSVEVGVRGTYRDTFRPGQAPWQGGVAAGDVGVYGKWVLVAGALQNRNWPRPSVALLGGVQFLTAQALWALEARAAGSLWIGPVLTHLSLGFHQDSGAGVLAGAVLSVPLDVGLVPALELSGEVRFAQESLASLMLAVSYQVPHVPITVDVAARRGLTAASPAWLFTAGLTLRLHVWRPRRGE